MGVPGHDERDFLFAKKFNLKITKVILEKGKEPESALLEAYIGDGILINSNEFNGLNVNQAKEEIVNNLLKKDIGSKKINFKLRDWLISRQRYWGTPISDSLL